MQLLTLWPAGLRLTPVSCMRANALHSCSLRWCRSCSHQSQSTTVTRTLFPIFDHLSLFCLHCFGASSFQDLTVSMDDTVHMSINQMVQGVLTDGLPVTSLLAF